MEPITRCPSFTSISTCEPAPRFTSSRMGLGMAMTIEPSTLRSVGGSIVMAIPKPILELVNLGAGSQVDIDVKDGHLVIGSIRRLRYTLAELLDQCDFSAPMNQETREWIEAPDVGLEVIG